MNGRDPGTFRSTAVTVIAYAIAMGYLEAAVVVYLRAALGLTPVGLDSLFAIAERGVSQT